MIEVYVKKNTFKVGILVDTVPLGGLSLHALALGIASLDRRGDVIVCHNGSSCLFVIAPVLALLAQGSMWYAFSDWTQA